MRVPVAGAAALVAGSMAGMAAAQPAPRPAAEDDPMAALARAVQNPVADLISLPVRINTNFAYAPRDDIQNALKLQPVVPVGLGAAWNPFTRTILPVVSQPGLEPGQGTTFGLGATQVSAFVSPARPGEVIWGAGAVVQAPTATDAALGSKIRGAGPTFVALTLRGPWVLGGLVNNIWSFGGGPRNTCNIMTLQPFINCDIPGSPGTYLSLSPIVTANWDARSGAVWTVPLGLAVGQVMPRVNIQLGAYDNLVRPDIGPERQARVQIAFLAPRPRRAAAPGANAAVIPRAASSLYVARAQWTEPPHDHALEAHAGPCPRNG